MLLRDMLLVIVRVIIKLMLNSHMEMISICIFNNLDLYLIKWMNKE